MILLIITPKDSQANMFNKFKKGFYFEKYKTSDEAKEALLKLHPIGSDVDALVSILKKAGMEVEKKYKYKSVDLKRDKFDADNEYEVMYAIYKSDSLLFKSYTIQILVKYDKNNVIKEFKLTSYHD